MKKMIQRISLAWLLVAGIGSTIHAIDPIDTDKKIVDTTKDHDDKSGVDSSDNIDNEKDAINAELDKYNAELEKYYEELAAMNRKMAPGTKNGSIVSASAKAAQKTGAYLFDKGQLVVEQALFGLAINGLQSKVREYWTEYTTEKARPLTEKDFAYVPKDVSDVIAYIKKSSEYDKSTRGDAKDLKAGILMRGASGTGKTRNAQLIAGALGAEFYSVSATQLQDKYMGESARKVRNLFAKARKCKKTVVIFIDEIHACGSSGAGADDDHKHIGDIHNAFLTELNKESGYDNSNIVFIGATNYDEAIETQLLQRMPKVITLGIPTQEERLSLLKFYFDKVNHTLTAKDLVFFSGYWRTGGWNARAFPNLVEQAKEVAIQQGKHTIDRVCVLKALPKVQKTFNQDIVSKKNLKKTREIVDAAQTIMSSTKMGVSLFGAFKGLLGLAA